MVAWRKYRTVAVYEELTRRELERRLKRAHGANVRMTRITVAHDDFEEPTWRYTVFYVKI